MKQKLFSYLLTLVLLLSLLPAVRAAEPEPREVVLSPQTLTVDGAVKDVQKYNIDGSNYFKLRDLAYLLSGTGSQFSVGWDAETNTVSIVTGEAYTPNGGELATGADKSALTVPSAQAIRINGETRDDLTVYNIGGENYFKLRELGAALGFSVDFDAAANTAAVQTAGAPQPEPTPEPEPEPEPSSVSKAPKEARLTIVTTEYALGMTEAELTALAGAPDETLRSTGGYEWYVFGTKTYRDFFLAGVFKGTVVALASAGDAFKYQDYEAGSTADAFVRNNYVNYYTDKNDSSILHAVLLRDRAALPTENDYSAEALRGEEIVNFHLTNAFRVFHSCRPFLWDESAAEAARLHSDDMAKRDYFSHDSLDGRTPAARMEAQGIRWSRYAENIAAGSDSGIGNYDLWVNSAEHRDNMLGDCVYLGVGFAYRPGSSYGCYMTQDFFTARIG